MPGLGSQELYRMVLDSLPVAVCAVDREGKVILWNDGAERVTGYLRQDVLGHLCTDAFLEHADTDTIQWRGAHFRCWRRCGTGKCLTVRASAAEESGQSVGVHVRTVPLRGDDGRMQGAAELFERDDYADAD